MENLKVQAPLRSIREQYKIWGSGANYTLRIVAGTGRQTGLEGAPGSFDDNLTN